ncbi:MAG: hypothetical protein ABW221_03190 [Vicinamibacteria bacterium]
MSARRAAWAALFLLGAAFWVMLLDRAPGAFAGPPVALEDWPKEYRYLAVLQQAVREARVPYVLSEPIVFSRKFLAIPETCLSPQAALLLVLAPGAFVIANTLLLHAAFCAGVVALARRFRLALVPAAGFYLLAGFNGHLTAHLAVGHSMWTGLLLLPAFLLPLVALAEDARAPRAPMLLALAMAAILFQGALHAFAWCVLLLLLFAAFNPSRLRPVVVALAWTAGAGALRLLPAVFVARRRETAFLSGYPSIGDLVRGLVTLLPPDGPKRGGAFGAVSPWELDAYVGPAGLALIVAGVVLFVRRGPDPRLAPLAGPIAVMALLALGDAGVLFELSRLPLLSAERVTSRLVALPLVIAALMAAVGLDRAWRTGGRDVRASVATAVAATALALAVHGWTWRVASLAERLPVRKGVVDVRIVDTDDISPEADRLYRRLVLAGALVSLATWTAAGARLRALRQRRDVADSAIPS